MFRGLRHRPIALPWAFGLAAMVVPAYAQAQVSAQVPAARVLVSPAPSDADTGSRSGAGARADAAQAMALTIDQAVREALDRNAALRADRENLRIASAAIVTAGLRPNPVVTASAMRADRVLHAAGVTPDEQIVRADYLFEGRGKRAGRIEQATLAHAVTGLQLSDEMRQLVLDVQLAFVDVQLVQRNLQLAQENLRTLQNVVQVNTDRVRAGDLAPVELERSRLAALQFQNEVRAQQAQLRIAQSALSVRMGRDPRDAAFSVTDDLRQDVQPLDYETLRRQALTRRPDLQAVRRDRDRADADLRLQLATGRIDYTVSAEYHRQQSTEVQGNAYGLFLSVPLPLFSRNQGEIARARAQRSQVELREEATRLSVAQDVTSAFARYDAARDRVATMERDMLTRAREVRTTLEYSYRRGEASLVELLDAVRAFNDTEQGYNDARADYARALYELDAVSGDNLPGGTPAAGADAPPAPIPFASTSAPPSTSSPTSASVLTSASAPGSTASILRSTSTTTRSDSFLHKAR